MNKVPQIVFVAAQTENLSDGGLESATQIFEALCGDFAWTLHTTHYSRYTARWSAKGADVHITELPCGDSGWQRILHYAKWMHSVAHSLRQLKPDVAHANDTRAYKALRLPAGLFKVPTLLSIRDTKPPGAPYPPHWKAAAESCERVITLSKEMSAHLMRAIGVPGDKFQSIYSIVDLERFRPAAEAERESIRSRLGIAKDDFAVGVFGSIRDKKSQLALLKNALPLLVDSCPRVRFHFFGDFRPAHDMYAAQCALAAAQYSAGVVTFHGHVDEISTRIQAMDCTVIASQNEGLARAMIESMACGVPVVSTDVCSSREMLDNTGAGQVVAQGDFRAMADRVVAIINDNQLRRSMAKAARRTAIQFFDRGAAAQAYRSLYLEIASRAPLKHSSVTE